MRLNVNTPLLDIVGNPLKVGNDTQSEEMVLAHVLIQIAIQAAPPNYNQGKGYTPEEQVQRWTLAMDCQRARDLDPPEIDVAAKVIAQLREDISRSYGPIIAGQVISILDAK